MKTIEDLLKHISNVFKLSTDYYLISNGLYLPSSEDVRVLKEDDVVMVVPSEPQKQSLSVDSKMDLENVESNKTSKRGRSICEESESEVFPFVKTKKKKKKKYSESNNVNHANSFDDSNVQKKEKKKIKNLFNKNVSELAGNIKQKEEVTTRGLNINSYNESEEQAICGYSQSNGESSKAACDEKREKFTLEESSNTDIKVQPAIKTNFEKPFIKRNKKVELMNISTKPKIVQTIRVSDSPMARCYNNTESLQEPCVVYSHHKVENPKMLSQRIITEHLQSKTEKESEINKNEEMPLPSGKNGESSTEPQSGGSKNNEIVEIPVQSVLQSTPIAKDKKNNEERIDTPFVLELNNNPASVHDNISERVKIISVTTISGELNQTSSKQLHKSENIGPQLIPVSSHIQTLPVIDKSLENEQHGSSLQSIQQNYTQESSSELNGDSVADLKDSMATESAVGSVTEDSSVNVSTETKRKRKRVRKRKPKSIKQENGFETPIYHKLSPIITAPALHIRFDDEQDEQTESSPKSVKPDVIDISLNYEKLCKEEIVKYPVMKDKLPKQGDVIAFKLYRLSKSYTPEISDIIIVKVLNFCPVTKNVTVKILEGADQCSTPEGKFYMENLHVEEKTDEKDFAWEELIEPRLLFP